LTKELLHNILLSHLRLSQFVIVNCISHTYSFTSADLQL